MPCSALDGVKPQIDPTCWIAPTADLIGRIRLHGQVSIWFGAILRGDHEMIDVGSQSNIQDGAVLHTDPGFPLSVGQACTVGHRAILHGCTISDGTLVGMGATILNGATIGAQSLVGANALVTEGKNLPDRSLVVGSPARAVRVLAQDEVDRIRSNALSYVANACRYSDTLESLRGSVRDYKM
ncbi:gamma carbonic anhydrase family protein [Devosia sp. A449]